MALGITVQSLITWIRRRGDFVNSAFLSDSTDLIPWINRAQHELADIVIAAYGEDYFLESSPMVFSVSGSVSTNGLVSKPIPAPLIGLGIPYKWVRFDYQVNNDFVPLRRFSLQDTVFSNRTYAWGDAVMPRYHIAHDNIYFTPRPSSKQIVRGYYIRLPHDITATGSEMDIRLEQWAEYIVTDCAIKAKEKENSDPGTLILAKEKLEKRIREMAPQRDAGHPNTVNDVRSVDDYGDSDTDGWW